MAYVPEMVPKCVVIVDDQAGPEYDEIPRAWWEGPDGLIMTLAGVLPIFQAGGRWADIMSEPRGECGSCFAVPARRGFAE